jgi:hypothetical protein
MPYEPAQPKYTNNQAVLAQNMTVKEVLADRVITCIYNKADFDLADELRSIAEDNDLLLKASNRSFTYKGKYYSVGLTEYDPQPLQEQLFARMDEYLEHRKQIHDYEIPVIKGILKSMFIASDHAGDYKEILPEQVHSAFDGYRAGSSTKRMTLNELARLTHNLITQGSVP